jgi:acyl-CoA hydrolase
MQSKTPQHSKTIMTEVVMPNDANPMGILQGGRIIHWMDIASAIAAQTHSGKICVTASVDQVAFRSPARVGDIVLIKARVTRAFKTSMEIYVEAWARPATGTEATMINEAWFTFVALDRNGKPTSVPELVPHTDKEKSLYEGAVKRREKRQS